jgi:hypothetical protein
MTQYPMNTAGMAYFEIKEISVNEWHPLPDGQGKPEQVHLMIEVDGFPHPLVIRYKSRRPVDELIVALITHAEHVWPRKNTGATNNE